MREIVKIKKIKGPNFGPIMVESYPTIVGSVLDKVTEPSI